MSNTTIFPKLLTGETDLSQDTEHSMEVIRNCGEEIYSSAVENIFDDKDIQDALFDCATSAIDAIDFLADRCGFEANGRKQAEVRTEFINFCLDQL